MERARACACDVLVLTVDTKIQGPRERDIRNGFIVPPRLTPSNLRDMLRHPGWLARVGLGPTVTFGNLAGTASAARDIGSNARFAQAQHDQSPDWRAREGEGPVGRPGADEGHPRRR